MYDVCGVVGVDFFNIGVDERFSIVVWDNYFMFVFEG